MKNFKVLFFVGLLLFSSSCATMFRTDSYSANIKVKDKPTAKIYVNGEYLGEGEVTKTFKRSKDMTVQLKHDGCPDYVKNFDKKLSVGFIFFNLTIIGIVVDLGNGAIYTPDNSYSEITKVNSKEFIIELTYADCPN
nr:hypothetical protein [Allomuricauda sp.]